MVAAFDTMISTATVTAEDSKKHKSNVPIIKLDDEQSTTLAIFLDKKKAKKSIESEMAIVETDLLKYFQSKADELMLKGKMYGTMEAISADNSNTVKFIMSDKFSVGDVESARKILGKNVVEQLVEEKIDIKVRPEVFENEQLQKELAKKLGDDFAKFFTVEKTWKAKSGLKEDIYKLSDGKQDILNKIRTFVVPVKPSIK